MTHKEALRAGASLSSLGLLILFGWATEAFAQRTQNVKQGYSMRVELANRGVFGRVAYPGAITITNFPGDSLGLEYPVGSSVEHVFGGGIWVGGKVDTARVGISERIKLVTTAYEGYGGAQGEQYLFEMTPGADAQDRFWTANKRDTVVPPGWNQYWGSSFRFRPISDQDYYCAYNDTNRRIVGHTPMGIKVIQSSYAWDDPYADAITIIEYRIINLRPKSLDSVYLAFFVDADVGPIRSQNYALRNYTGYYDQLHTAYIHNPADRGSTPFGVALLKTPKRLDSLRYSFRWYPLAQSPGITGNDPPKYDYISSGTVQADEYPALSDTRFLFGFGPFFIKPSNDPQPDTLVVAVGIVSGKDLTTLQRNAGRATDIYLNQGIKLPATPPSPPLRVTVGFRKVALEWKWRSGDDALFGRPDPELNWDTTNQVARLDRRRYQSPPSPPPGIDSTKGGRNFEAYRLWRSEYAGDQDPPVSSFTLLRQFDVPDDPYEYNTGLQYSYIDSNLVRGKRYHYSVTSKSIPNLAYQRNPSGGIDTIQVEPLESGILTNRAKIDIPFAVSKAPGKVAVVPNPYRTDQDFTYKSEGGGYEGPLRDWDENKRSVKFINLPERCTIRVFSLAGDLIRTILHDGSASSFPRGDEDMPLLSESNRALASGIYIFVVESEYGAQTGKFVIIR